MLEICAGCFETEAVSSLTLWSLGAVRRRQVGSSVHRDCLATVDRCFSESHLIDQVGSCTPCERKRRRSTYGSLKSTSSCEVGATQQSVEWLRQVHDQPTEAKRITFGFPVVVTRCTTRLASRKAQDRRLRCPPCPGYVFNPSVRARLPETVPFPPLLLLLLLLSSHRLLQLDSHDLVRIEVFGNTPVVTIH